MKLTGAQIIIEQLCKHRADVVFGYPGGAVLPVYDELYKNADRIRHVITAHEQGAAHAADGYARVTGRAGVVIATSGPGATNLVTGIANAYLDSVPLVALTGNVAVPLLGKDSFQEVNIQGITRPVVKFSLALRSAAELEPALDQAFQIALSGRPGPVLIDIPKSVQTELADYPAASCEPAVSSAGEQGMQPEELQAVLAMLQESEKPFIYAGGGILAAGAEKELAALAERLDAPMGFSMMGLTAVPCDHPLNLGMCGMHGKYASNMAQAESDLILALGVRFSDRATGNVQAYRAGRRIVHVDIDGRELGKNVDGDLMIRGNVKVVLQQLLQKLPVSQHPGWRSRLTAWQKTSFATPEPEGFLSPERLVRTVAASCSPDTVVATDVGQHQMWVMQHYPFRCSRTLLTSGGLGTMGYGMGAAIGGCIAGGRARTVLFTGDGSFGMNLHELATAVREKLPLTVVIFHNGVLGMVRQWQTLFYEKHYSQTTLSTSTDFVKLAEAFGAVGKRVNTVQELQDALRHTPADGPMVLDCLIDRDEFVLPMIPPGGTAGDMMVVNTEKNSSVKRSFVRGIKC